MNTSDRLQQMNKKGSETKYTNEQKAKTQKRFKKGEAEV